MWSPLLIGALLLSCSSAQLTVSTPPSLVQCQPVMISWSGGTAPYILAVIPGGQPDATALETVNGDLSASPYTWKVDIAGGTSVTLKITDATGAIQYSSPITIQSSNDGSCLNGGNSGIEPPPPPSTTSSIASTSTVATSSSKQQATPSTSSTESIGSEVTPSSTHTIAAITTSAATRTTSTTKILSTPVNPTSGSAIGQNTSGRAFPQATGSSGVLSGSLGLVVVLVLLV